MTDHKLRVSDIDLSRVVTGHKAKIPVFSGYPEEDVLAWLHIFYKNANALGWNDREKLSRFPLYLSGSAVYWYTSHIAKSTESLSSFNALRDKFISCFLPDDFSAYVNQQLRNYTQGYNQTVTSYIFTVERLCRQKNPNMSEKEIIEYLYDGIHPQIRSLVKIQNPTSISEFIIIAKRVEASLRGGQTTLKKTVHFAGQTQDCRTPVIGHDRKTRSDQDQIDPTIDKILQSLEKLNKRVDEISRPRDSRYTSDDTRRKDNKPNAIARRGPPDEPTCFYCGRPGHVVEECRTKKRAQEMRARERFKPAKVTNDQRNVATVTSPFETQLIGLADGKFQGRLIKHPVQEPGLDSDIGFDVESIIGHKYIYGKLFMLVK